jgi:hypothetical protein
VDYDRDARPSSGRDVALDNKHRQQQRRKRDKDLELHPPL